MNFITNSVVDLLTVDLSQPLCGKKKKIARASKFCFSGFVAALLPVLNVTVLVVWAGPGKHF